MTPQLEKSPDARREFVQAIRAILNPDDQHPEDGSNDFFAADPETLFQNLSGDVRYTPTLDTGGATSISGEGAAGFIGDIASGLLAGARRIANFGTYYEIKTRAGIVGQSGAALVLARVRERRPDLPLNLVGHSFGGRLVTAAASRLVPGAKAVTMMLLQAAFSHNGLAAKFDGTHDGAFRTVLQDRRISGPLLITHTKRDSAVGIAYPLASRIARQAAAALGDEGDPYGGIGRNGAQRTPEAEFKTLGGLGHRVQIRAEQGLQSESRPVHQRAQRRQRTSSGLRVLEWLSGGELMLSAGYPPVLPRVDERTRPQGCDLETMSCRDQIFTGPSGARNTPLRTAKHGLIAPSLVDSAATLA